MNFKQHISVEFSRAITNDIIKLHHKFNKRNPETIIYARTRNVFIYKNVVVKLPSDPLGIHANEWEGSVSNTKESFDNQDWEQYPHTRLLYWKNIPILYMEKVKVITPNYDQLPYWAGYIDCGQVGYTKKGRLVAYDYAPY